MTPLGFLALALTIAASAFIQGATGMGFAMVAAPVVALIDPRLIPVMLLVLMIPLNGYISWRERGAIDWRGVRWISVGRFVGTFGGLWVLLIVTTRGLSLIIGWTTLLAVAAALLAPAFHPSRSALGAVGVITGITETATGVGGPPLALAYQHGPGPTLRSTITMCFLIGEIISLAVLGVTGQISSDALVISAWLLPFVIAGALASRFVHHRLDGALLRYLVLGFSAAAGLAVIIQV